MVKYNLKTGAWKTVKTNLYIWAPAVLAFLASVPPEYAWVASVIVYFIKNWLKIEKNWNV